MWLMKYKITTDSREYYNRERFVTRKEAIEWAKMPRTNCKIEVIELFKEENKKKVKEFLFD